MKVRCILSHEKPVGRLFEKGKVYDMPDGFSGRYFEPVEQDEDEIAASQKIAPRNDDGEEVKPKKKKESSTKKKKELYN